MGPALAVAKPVDPLALSPARQQLALHVDKVRAATAELAEARAPWDRLSAEGDRARANQRAAVADLEGVNAREAGDLRSWAIIRATGEPRPAPRDDERAAAQAAVDQATRTVQSIERAIGEVGAPLNEASRRLSELDRQTDVFILKVLEEEHAVALGAEREAAVKLAAAEAAAFGLIDFLASYGRSIAAGDDAKALWFRAADRMRKAREASPNMPTVAPPDWPGLAARLIADPSATLEAA